MKCDNDGAIDIYRKEETNHRHHVPTLNSLKSLGPELFSAMLVKDEKTRKIALLSSTLLLGVGPVSRSVGRVYE